MLSEEVFADDLATAARVEDFLLVFVLARFFLSAAFVLSLAMFHLDKSIQESNGDLYPRFWPRLTLSLANLWQFDGPRDNLPIAFFSCPKQQQRR